MWHVEQIRRFGQLLNADAWVQSLPPEVEIQFPTTGLDRWSDATLRNDGWKLPTCRKMYV